MSDSLRQSTTDKVESAVKPDSQKSYVEQATDAAKSAGDSVAATLQPSSEKSATQQASDAVSGDGQTGKSYLEQAQEVVGNAVESAKDALGLNEPSK